MRERKTTRNSLKDAFFVVDGKTRFATPVAVAYICWMVVNTVIIAAAVNMDFLRNPLLGNPFSLVVFLKCMVLFFGSIASSLLGYCLGKKGLLLASIVAFVASLLTISLFKTDVSAIQVLIRGPWLSLIAANLAYVGMTPVFVIQETLQTSSGSKTYYKPIIFIMIVTIGITAVVSLVPIFGLSPGDFTISSMASLIMGGFVIGALIGQYDWLEFGPL